jgi:small subunit ribosomal protein S15
MARMHSRRKGKSGSKRPLKRQMPGWVRYSDKEVEMLITKLAKENRTSSEIGMILRDLYGVPDIKTITHKTVNKVLKEKSLLPELPEDLVAMMRKLVALRQHTANNRQDMSAKKGQQMIEAKIKRLIKYYKRSGRIPVKWKYDVNKLKMYTE